MDKPPLYLKLWVWMLGQANFRDREKLNRGQFVTSIAEMQKAMSHRVGYRLKTPTKDEIRSAYEAFAKATMITTTKTTRGMIVTICNYDKYQTPKSYEAHSEPHNENTTKPTVTPHDTEYIEEREDIPLRSFDTFWKVYPKKKGKQDATKAWGKLNPGSGLQSEILNALEKHKLSSDWKKDDGQFIPYPATWLRGRRWEDEVQAGPEPDPEGY